MQNMDWKHLAFAQEIAETILLRAAFSKNVCFVCWQDFGNL